MDFLKSLADFSYVNCSLLSCYYPIINLHEYISELRLFKDNYEQEVMLEAGRISSLAHIKAMQSSKAGIQEYYLEAELIYTFKQNKAQDSDDIINIRIYGAKEEIIHATDADYIVINEDFNTALDNLIDITRTANLITGIQCVKNYQLIKNLAIL